MRHKDRMPHHGRGGSQHIGRTRTRLAKIVSECLGVDCEPYHLQPATGANRTNTGLDIYAWEVFTSKNGVPFVAGSFDTMTECVKAGKVTLHRGEISAHYENQSANKR